VTDRSFDTIIRDATAGVSRRTSLMSLGAVGLLAALAGQVPAEAAQVTAEKKSHKNKKKKCPPPVDQCAPQAEECTALLGALCAGQAECQDSVACCSFLGTCRASAFVSCLLASF